MHQPTQTSQLAAVTAFAAMAFALGCRENSTTDNGASNAGANHSLVSTPDYLDPAIQAEAKNLLLVKFPTLLPELRNKYANLDRGTYIMTGESGAVYEVRFDHLIFSFEDSCLTPNPPTLVFAGNIAIFEQGQDLALAAMPIEEAKLLLSKIAARRTFVIDRSVLDQFM